MDTTETNLLNGDQAAATAAITPASVMGASGPFLSASALHLSPNFDVPAGGDPGGTLTGYDPINDPEVSLINYGYFDGGSGADQYTGYQGDFGNYNQVSNDLGGPPTLTTLINDNNLGFGDLQYAINVAGDAGNLKLASEYLSNDFLQIIGDDPFLGGNPGGNVGQGFQELGQRAILLGGAAAGAGLGAAALYMGGPEGIVLDPAGTVGAMTALGDSLIDMYNAATGPLDANEVSALNSIAGTVGSGINAIGSFYGNPQAGGFPGALAHGLAGPASTSSSGPPPITGGYSLTGTIAVGSTHPLSLLALPPHGM